MNLQSNKNQYTLRDGYPYVQGDDVLVGPELLYLSLDQAYAIRGVLEEAGTIKREWEALNHERLRAVQIQKRVQMYVRQGVDPKVALEKARATVLKTEELEKAKAEEGAKAPTEPASTG